MKWKKFSLFLGQILEIPVIVDSENYIGAISNSSWTAVCAYVLYQHRSMFFYFYINLLLIFVNVLIISGEENVKVMSNKEAYDDLKRRLSSIKKSCGEVCDQTIEGDIHTLT